MGKMRLGIRLRQEIDGYLRDYGDAIAKTRKPLKIGISQAKIELKSFKDLLNFAMYMGESVVYYENATAATFYCTKDDAVYYFAVWKIKKQWED
jgi:hypothetical protein